MTHLMPLSLRARIEVCLSLVDVHTGKLTHLGRLAATDPSAYPITHRDLCYAEKLGFRNSYGDEVSRNNRQVANVQYFSKVKP